MKTRTLKLLLTSLLLAAVHNPAFAQGLTFTTNALNLANGSGPTFIAITDVNDDGKLDLITANNNNNNLTILTNSGGGTFVVSAALDVGNSPQSIVAADLNGNGKVELVSANNGDGTLTVFTNSDTGGFGFNTLLDAFGSPRCLVAADIYGRGKLDLITVNSGPFPDFTGTLTVLTNNGNGVFGSNTVLNVDGSPNAVVASDINGDGKLDLISANSGSFPDSIGTLNVLTNNGLGLFVFDETITVETIDGSSGPVSLNASDINGDGQTDLITANSDSSTVTVYTNTGHGNFALSTMVAVGSSPNFVATRDLNGDGRPDLVTVNFGNSTLTILTNAGAGKFGANATLAGGLNPSCIRIADLNGDGKPDLATSINGEDKLKVFLNGSTFPTASSQPALSTKRNGNLIHVTWPAASPGWSLQQSANVLKPQPWLPSGYDGYEITDSGTNKSLTLPVTGDSKFFKLYHP